MTSELDDYFSSFILKRIAQTKGNVSDTASALKLALRLVMNQKTTRAAGACPTALQASKQCSFLNYWLLSRGALGDEMRVAPEDTEPIDQEQADRMVEQTRAFLEQSCKDLLVVGPPRGAQDDFHESRGLLHASHSV